MAVPEYKKDRVITLEGLEVYTEQVQTMYDQTIIALFIKGREITYMTGDGKLHTFIGENNAIYSLGTEEKTGLTKLYKTVGGNEDGTMTQNAITAELMKKAEVSLDADQHTLIFSNTTKIEKEN